MLLLLVGSSAASYADHPTLSLDEGGAGPLTTISAIGLPDGDFGVSFQTQFLFNDEISDSRLMRYGRQGNPVHSTGQVTSYSINSALGIGEDLTLGFSLPYLIRNDFREAVITSVAAAPVVQPRHAGPHPAVAPGPTQVANVISYDIEGLSDATLFGQYELFENEASGLHLALLGGIKMPTGKTDVRGPGGFLVATDHQPGSGSWDPLVGLALTKQGGAWSFDMSGLYTFSNEGARDTVVGDIFNYNAAVSYRLIGGEEEPHDHHSHSPGEVVHEHDHHDQEPGLAVDVFVEANGDYRENAVASGIVDPNTGGNLIFLSGGSRVSLPGGWAAAFSVGAPVVMDLNGIQSEPNMRVLIGISKSF